MGNEEPMELDKPPKTINTMQIAPDDRMDQTGGGFQVCLDVGRNILAWLSAFII